MHLFKEFLQPQLESLIFTALVEFAEEMTTGAKSGVAKGQSCIAEVLYRRWVSALCAKPLMYEEG